MTTFQVLIKSIASEAIDIKSYELVSADGSSLPGFTAGAHIDVRMSPNLMRQYSLCNDPREKGRYVIAVKKEAFSRGGSKAMHDSLKPGDLLTISAPRNNFVLFGGANHSRLVAGGIGITPILAMARELAATEASFDLHYFARSREHAAFRELLAGEAFVGTVSFHYLQDPREVEQCLRALFSTRPEGAHLYLCGPRPFMDMVQAASRANWPANAVHLEYFTADEGPVAAPRDGFKVKLARSGAVYEIPADKSIVDVLLLHNIVIDTSCEQGVCGTCLTFVLEGTPDHRDMFLTDEEKQVGDRMTLCVSRSKSPLLVLDL